MRHLAFLAALALLLMGGAPAARAQSCLEMPPDEAAIHAGELTTLLKIANFRADVTYMSEVAQELEVFLGTCGDEATGRIAQVCNFDCHAQLGRFRLFLAADLPFLSSASGVSRNDTPLSPQAAQDIARLGIDVVDRGLRILARQQGGGQDAEGQEASYRSFVRQLVTLNALKIQLLMNTGDIWYQTVSEARVKQLDFMIAETLESVGGAGLESQPNLFKANTNYEAALWTLVETKMDIPGESTYDDLRADLLLIENDLTERAESVRKGYLFLNIDPLQFTTIPFEELQAKLAETERDLAEVEGKVEAIVERWHANKLGEATRVLDEGRTIRGQEINLIAHQIGKLEEQSQVFANTVSQEVAGIDAQKDSFGYRQQIRSLEIQLATKLSEFENQRRQISERSELDLIVLSKEAESERRNELRWLLNWEMTQMNLDLQISSLESQIAEYDRQSARNTNQLDQLQRQRGILESQIATANTNIAQSEETIAEIDQRRTVIFAKSRAAQREDICGIENQLSMIGEPIAAPFAPLLPGEEPCQTPAPAFTRTEYLGQMCGTGDEPGLRAKILDGQIQARAFVMKCVVGDADFADLEPLVDSSTLISTSLDLPAELAAVDCGDFTQTETDFARKMYESEKESYTMRRADLEQARDQVTAQLAEIASWFVLFTGTTQTAQIALTVAQAGYATAAAIPTTTVCACGMASGAETEIDVSRAAKAAVDAQLSILQSIISTGTVTQQNINQMIGLNQQITRLQQQIGQIDLDLELKAQALERTHFQLAGRRAEGIATLKEQVLQTSVAALECDSQELGINEQVGRLNADHARRIAGLDLAASENELLSFQTAEQQRNIDRYRTEIEILTLELEKLALTERQLADDNAAISALVAATEGRILRVQTTQATVNGLSEESSAATNVINELRDRQAAQMLALSDGELAFVERRITQETANTEILVEGLDEAMALGLKSAALKSSILEFQGSILGQVGAEQEKLTELVSQIDDADVRRNLFTANQETLAELMKGIPEYLVSKRRSLETANQLLHLMRRRFVVVNAVTGNEENQPEIYVRNATQLSALVDDIVNKRFFDERQINIDVAQIVVPANSGFARKLALTETVDFEISPFAATEAAMKTNGYFALWSPTKFRDRRNLTLIDAFIGTQYQCTGAQWNRFALAHRGSGFVFRPLAEGSREVTAEITVGPERAALQTFFNLADSQDEVNRVIRYWLGDRFQVRRFPRPAGPPNDTQSVLPYLGAPVIGSYRLSLQPSDCPFDNAVFTLYVIFASAP